MRIFVTGATGYIGGSVCQRLMSEGHRVCGLTRSPDKANALAERGIEPIVGDLQDHALLTRAASAADAVINAASADDAAALDTLLAALSRSAKLLIHTSGSAIVADNANGEHSACVYSEDDVFEPVPFRRERVEMNRRVRLSAMESGVRGVVICPPMIYGEGRGLERDSDQIPKLIALSKHVGAGLYLGRGLNVYSNIFIDDLVSLYVLAIERAPGGSFFFAENGEMSFKQIAENIARVIGVPGQTKSLSVEDVARQYGEAARLGLASNSRVSAKAARRLGWTPKGPSLSEWFATVFLSANTVA